MHKYFVSYGWVRYSGGCGDGDIIVDIPHKIKTGDDLSQVKKIIKTNNGFDSIVIFNYKLLSDDNIDQSDEITRLRELCYKAANWIKYEAFSELPDVTGAAELQEELMDGYRKGLN